MAKTVEAHEDKRLAAQTLYRYHASSGAWRQRGRKSRELVTDASVKTPDCGAMAGYVMALEAAKAAAEKAAAEKVAAEKAQPSPLP